MVKRPAPLGLAILSWKSHRTLAQTLHSLQNLFAFFDQTLIFFQEPEAQDRALARAFGLPYKSSQRNIGIQNGMKALALSLQTPYILHLENDFSLVQSVAVAKREITIAHNYLCAGTTHFATLREEELFLRGQKYLRYHSEPDTSDSAIKTVVKTVRRLVRPAKARRLKRQAAAARGLAVDGVSRVLEHGHLCLSSRERNWTNQAVLYPKKLFLDTLIPFAEAHPSRRTVNGFADLEKEFNCRWWRRRGFRIGRGPGVFGSRRLDRPDGDEKRFLDKTSHERGETRWKRP